MGLDITAYRNLTEKPNAALDEDGYPEEGVRFWNNADFPGRFDGLKEGMVYEYAECYDFRAGGYGGYNEWRERLAKLAEYPATEYKRWGLKELRHDAGAWARGSGPFYELINFADNEGTIGPVVAKKLAADFAEWDERAKATGDEWFYDRYQAWRKAFEMAADNGAVSFH
jgi:hypothetical protein